MTNIKNKRVVAHLKKYQAEHDLNDTKMAALLGKTKQHYSLWVSGNKGISNKSLQIISEKLGIPEDKLLDWPSDHESQEETEMTLEREILVHILKQMTHLSKTIENLSATIANMGESPPFQKGTKPRKQNKK